jgi:hypothetical protein
VVARPALYWLLSVVVDVQLSDAHSEEY